MTDRTTAATRPAAAALALALGLGLTLAAAAHAQDPIRALQEEYAANKAQKAARAYHFGSQGAGGVFSNHASHTNRLVPIYTFGTKLDLGAITGANSSYRDPEKIKAMYGTLPANTHNPEAEYADQSDLYRLQVDAVAGGVRHLFIVWFDGMDWDAARAAAIAKSGRVYGEGKGSGLTFQDYAAGGSARFGFVVTSPTHDKNDPDVDAQAVTIPADSLGGGYDARIAGPTPWTPGRLAAPGYLKGQNGSAEDRSGVLAVGGVPHAYTDSSTSAGEFATGVKSYNNGINVSDDGRFLPTLFGRLQGEGWRVGTVTSVPFDHASPAAMYAHNVHRDDYEDLGRDMLGLPGITQLDGKEARHPGLDVVIGTGFGQALESKDLKSQGRNAVAGDNMYLADADLRAVDVAHGGPYVVAHTEPGVNGGRSLQAAAGRAAAGGHRLFGFYGNSGLPRSHLPYRTADGRFDPARGIRGTAESYSPADIDEAPTLADMTRAALAVLSSRPGGRFALFIEAGDVDWGLHDNNLDNAIGAIVSGDDAVKAVIAWVEARSNWDDAALIVTADHGHYLVVDDPAALAATK